MRNLALKPMAAVLLAAFSFVQARAGERKHYVGTAQLPKIEVRVRAEIAHIGGGHHAHLLLVHSWQNLHGTIVATSGDDGIMFLPHGATVPHFIAYSEIADARRHCYAFSGYHLLSSDFDACEGKGSEFMEDATFLPLFPIFLVLLLSGRTG